jgi:hypothetical protein
VLVAPAGSGIARVHLRNNQIDENTCGIAAARFGADPAFNFAANCGTLTTGGTATVAVNALNNDLADNISTTVFSNGSSTTVRIGGNTIVGSIGPALQAANGAALLTFGNNTVTGNPGGNGATTGSAGGFSKRRARRG